MSVKVSKAIVSREMPGRFTDLVALLPPHVIQDESDYENTIDFIDKLLARPKLTRGQTEFFDTWAVLIEAYENEHHAIKDAGMNGLESLKHLLEPRNMTASDLGLLLGNRSLGSKILREVEQSAPANSLQAFPCGCGVISRGVERESYPPVRRPPLQHVAPKRRHPAIGGVNDSPSFPHIGRKGE